jgi:hypothetical protein
VPITAAWLGLNQSLLVGAVTFTKDENGTRTGWSRHSSSAQERSET